jgi:hypothetical protein
MEYAYNITDGDFSYDIKTKDDYWESIEGVTEYNIERTAEGELISSINADIVIMEQVFRGIVYYFWGYKMPFESDIVEFDNELYIFEFDYRSQIYILRNIANGSILRVDLFLQQSVRFTYVGNEFENPELMI